MMEVRRWIAQLEKTVPIDEATDFIQGMTGDVALRARSFLRDVIEEKFDFMN